jgi:hypothetical protein
MRRSKYLLLFSALIVGCLSVLAAAADRDRSGEPALRTGPGGAPRSAGSTSEPRRLLSPTVARKFYEVAYELGKSEGAGPGETEQAIVLLRAAMSLDGGADYVRPLLLELACRDTGTDYSKLVQGLLQDYVNESADLKISRDAIMYLLRRLNSREERESLLGQMLQQFSSKKPVLGSDVATLLGELASEKLDLDSAGFYFAQAYRNNKYNTVAFSRLAELFPDRLGPELYLERLRLALRENPSDIDAALELAQYAERLGLYEIAGQAYNYTADLFGYLYPSEALPAKIYLPWAICSYNTERSEHKCLQIAQLARKDGRFDLLMEALAGKAATKMGDGQQATQIFQAAEEKAGQLLLQGPEEANKPGLRPSDISELQQVGAKQFAWFYCFALPNPQKALEWANRAYSTDPNSASAAGILAYALVMNDQSQWKWAKPMLDNYKRTQIADVALAQIQISEGKKAEAVETLKSAIARDPGSFAAERAKEILVERGTEYIPPIDAGVVRNVLEQMFGRTIVPKFTEPDRLISIQFNIRGNKFPYGSDFGGVVAITNNSTEPLVISDAGLFKGNIRIDAEVTGDLSRTMPKLVSVKVRTDFLIEPGQSILVPVRLITGELRRIMLTHPQASLDIGFTLYLDPVVGADGIVTNRLVTMAPTRVSVKRPGLELTGKYLRNRFNLISTGHQGQKIKTAQLFVGLLMEQYAMSNRKPPYKFMYADWMPTMFRNALIHESGLLLNAADAEWVVKAYAMAEMLSLPLDHELLTAVAENLNNTNWPVRMMAIYLLAKTQDKQFDKVLGWAAKYDSSAFVQDMAVALGAAGALGRQELNGIPEPEAVEKAIFGEPAEEK